MTCQTDFLNIPSPIGEPLETSHQDFNTVLFEKSKSNDDGDYQTPLQCHQKGVRKRKTQDTSGSKKHSRSSSSNCSNAIEGERTALSQSAEVRTDCPSEPAKSPPLFRFVRLENGILNVVPINPTATVAPNTSECEQQLRTPCVKPTSASKHAHQQSKPHRLLSRPKKAKRTDRSTHRNTSNGVTRRTLSGIKNFPAYADMVVNAQRTLLESMSSFTIKRACMPREVRSVKRKPSTPISISQVTSILNYQDQMNLLLKLEYQHLLRIAEQVQAGVFPNGDNGRAKGSDNFQDWRVLNSCTVTHPRPVVQKRDSPQDGMDVVQAALFSTFGSSPAV